MAGKYKVELVKEDNVYDAAQTKPKYDKIKDDVVMFGQILGTPPTQAVLADLKRDGIVASPASLDAAWVREPNLLPDRQHVPDPVHQRRRLPDQRQGLQGQAHLHGRGRG